MHCTDLKQTNTARLLWQREMPEIENCGRTQCGNQIGHADPLKIWLERIQFILVSVFAWTSAGDLLNDLLKPRRARKSVGLPWKIKQPLAHLSWILCALIKFTRLKRLGSGVRNSLHIGVSHRGGSPLQISCSIFNTRSWNWALIVTRLKHASVLIPHCVPNSLRRSVY